MKYFPIFQDMAEAMASLSHEDKGELLDAMMAYAFDGEIKDLSGNGRFLWPLIRKTIDQSREAYARMVENGRSGAQKRWRANRDPIESDRETVETDSMNNTKTNTNTNTKTNTKSMGASRFVPPTEEEVRAYVTEKGGTPSQAEQIFAYYESNGWRVGKNPMRKWRAAVSGWISRDKERATPRTAPVKAVPEQLYSQRDYGSGNIIPDDWLEAAQ